MFCPQCAVPLAVEDSGCRSCGATPASTAPTAALEPSSGKGSLSTEFSPGALFADRFTIIEKAGEGGMGVVYKARHERLNRYVAVKIINPNLHRISGGRTADFKRIYLKRFLSSGNC